MNKTLLVISLLATQASAIEIDAARQDELLYLLKQDCGSCHGMTLKGGLGPALLPETLAGKPESYLVTTILEGRENTAMPPWKSMLSKDEAIWLTEQLQSGRLIKTELVKNELNRNELSNNNQSRDEK